VRSETIGIRTIRAIHPTDGRPVVFVDTPGFDNTFKSDTEILTMVADWLRKAKRENIKIAAILYLHRISDNRMSGFAMKSLQLFSNLCGSQAMVNVVIVTTMWSKVGKEGTTLEQALEAEVWKEMLDSGCRTERFENTSESAWNIVGCLMQNNPGATLLIQDEMRDARKSLDKTTAGRTGNRNGAKKSYDENPQRYIALFRY